MRKGRLILGSAVLISLLTACGGADTQGGEETVQNNTTTYQGISWKGEAKGVKLEDTDQKIETTLTLDDEGIIKDVRMDFLALKDGEWIARNNPEAEVSIDFSVDPQAAVPGSEYKKGVSMFDIKTNDMMSFYALGVDGDGTVALAIVDPVIRYKLEAKLEPGFDFHTQVGELTINNEMVPTVRTSGSGLLKPEEWSEVEGKNIFDLHIFNHVMFDYGVLEGIDETSTVEEMLTALGVEFEDGVPSQMEPTHGFHSNGGWKGNYDSVAEYLRGKNANEVTSLIDWSVPRYAKGINEENAFGIESRAGATRTAQDSFDSIAGSTVRMSRENTSYQAALVDAGIISEEEVIKGRF